MKTFFFLVAFAIAVPTLAQDSMDIEQLFSCIDSYYQQRTAADLSEFEDSEKGAWLKYLPAVGVTYTVTGQPRPSISYSSSILYNSIQAKEQKQLKRVSIGQVSGLDAQETKRQVAKLVATYNLKLLDIQQFTTLIEIDRQLFAIKQSQYDNAELLPDNYLQARKAYLMREYELQQRQQGLEALKAEILAESKCLLY